MISSFKVRRRNITKTISPEKVILKSINHSFLELEKTFFMFQRGVSSICIQDKCNL